MKYIRRGWLAILKWLEEHEPVFCFGCGRLKFLKDTLPEWVVFGYKVNLCQECHRELYGWCEPEKE